MRILTLTQPWASLIAIGAKTLETTLRPLPGEPERSFGDYTPGRFAWRLTEVQPLLRPVPFVGARGLRPIADVAAIGAIFKEVQP